MLHAVKVKPDVYWVGGIDWNERNFHGYTTDRGSTYNAYLIMDEQVTLIDTCKPAFAGELIERISEVVDPACIEHVIVNHVEQDHSGAVPAISYLAPRAKIYASGPHGVNGLTAHYGDRGYVPVKTGDTLRIGKRTLSFTQTMMVHWPDNRPRIPNTTASCSPTTRSASISRRRSTSTTRWACPRCWRRRRNTTPTSSCRTRAMFKRRSSRSKGARST